MKKRLCIVSAIVAILFIVFAGGHCWAQADIIGGTAVGFNIHGPDGNDSGSAWTLAFAGARADFVQRALGITDSTIAVYMVMQYGNLDSENEVGGIGGKLLLVQQTFIDKVWFLYGIGWMQDIAENADGTTSAGMTFDAGISISVTKHFNFITYGVAMDRGEDFQLYGFVGVGVDDLKLGLF